ncbi:MAG: hypothetical protein JOZ24_07760 [Candidatus Eremiobacteraeota bacterium]|nr:hypothetical protein [Candidatus Eremiobacteraeota bacterium]
MPPRPAAPEPAATTPSPAAPAAPAAEPPAEPTAATEAAAAQPPSAEPVAPVAPVAPEPAAQPGLRRVRLVFAPDALQRALAFLEQSDYGGLVTHLFAIRTLLPTAFVGLNGDVPGRLAAEREALRGVVDRLFIKMRMPRYALSGKDVEDRASRSALVELIAGLRDAQPGDDAGAPPNAIVLEGSFDVARITRHLAALEAEPLGSARPWLVLAELLPTTALAPARGDSFAAYRSALVAAFTNVAAMPHEEFHRVLGGLQNAALDAALRDVRAALRDALEASG